jgi:regulator of sigma E protease
MLEVAVGIGVLILVHEFGHFIFAKYFGVKVEKFSMGFGPELVGVTYGETRYSIRIVPLGGYVKMLGEEPDSQTATDPRSFLVQPFLTKAAIIIAGSVFNILLALVFFITVFQVGITFPAAHVGGVEYGMPAYYAGLQVGDRVVEIDGRRTVDFSDLAVTSALADPGHSLSLVIERGGEEMPVTVYPEYNPSQAIGQIGVQPYPTLTIESLFTLGNAPSPLMKAGVEPGSTITAMNGTSVSSWVEFSRLAVANGLKPFTITVSKGNVEKTVEVSPVRDPSPLLAITVGQTLDVTKVTMGSIAEAIGLEAGDVITALGATRVSDMGQLSWEITKNLANLPSLEVTRNGKTVELSWNKDRLPLGGLAFASGFETRTMPQPAWVAPGSPAAMMGLEPGDVITSVDGRPVTDFESIRQFLKDAKGDTITVAWTRNGTAMQASFQPIFLGVVPAVETVERHLGLAASCSLGVRKAWDFASQIYIIIRKAVTGQSSIGKKLSGPIGIARVSYTVARQGFTQFLFFLAVIGVNLGVMNLLPIPILDGGLLAIFIVERIKGSPLRPSAQAALQYAGLVIIVMLFLYVTWQDVYRIVKGVW